MRLRCVALGTSCLIAVISAGCGGAAIETPGAVRPAGPPGLVQPGAPGVDSRVVSAGTGGEMAHTDADVAFMQGMIGHHAQALEMTALLYSRSTREDMKLLAKRIDVSQTDEIKMMKTWLADRAEEVPGEHAHHAPGAPLMPGMVSPAEMARLASASGVDFDRLFLEFMIKHHEGALSMVRDLFAKAGAGQEAMIFAFASDVEADQAMEIRRMQAMLAAIKTRAPFPFR